jgi:hypothetical protein
MASTRPSECLAADDALARGAWAEAREAFEEALGVREIPEALEGLGNAAWWLDLADLVFNSREHAYRLYLSRGDRADAARVAVWLAWDYWAFRGESAVANGWLQRARRLLDGQPPCHKPHAEACSPDHGDGPLGPFLARHEKWPVSAMRT